MRDLLNGPKNMCRLTESDKRPTKHGGRKSVRPYSLNPAYHGSRKVTNK